MVTSQAKYFTGDRTNALRVLDDTCMAVHEARDQSKEFTDAHFRAGADMEYFALAGFQSQDSEKAAAGVFDEREIPSCGRVAKIDFGGAGRDLSNDGGNDRRNPQHPAPHQNVGMLRRIRAGLGPGPSRRSIRVRNGDHCPDIICQCSCLLNSCRADRAVDDAGGTGLLHSLAGRKKRAA
jgi:hypothetical protein